MMLGAAALANDAANGLGIEMERMEGPALFRSAQNTEFGKVIKYDEAAAALEKAPNFTELVRPLTLRGIQYYTR